MTENPGYVAERRDQRVAGAEAAPLPAPSDAETSTHTSTVVTESPTNVTAAPADHAVVATPAGPGTPAGSAITTRTTMVSGDPAYRGVQMVWFFLGVINLVRIAVAPRRTAAS